MNPDDVLYGHWHQPYKPPWWRVIKRWRLRRRSVVVPGSLTRIDGNVPGPGDEHELWKQATFFDHYGVRHNRVGRFVQFEDLPPAEQQRIDRWFGR